MAVCDYDCAHCRHPDCINDSEPTMEETTAAAKRDRQARKEGAPQSRWADRYRTNPEYRAACLARSKVYYRAHKEALIAYQKEYYQAHKAELQAYGRQQSKAYRAAHSEEIKRKKREKAAAEREARQAAKEKNQN